MPEIFCKKGTSKTGIMHFSFLLFQSYFVFRYICIVFQTERHAENTSAKIMNFNRLIIEL